MTRSTRRHPNGPGLSLQKYSSTSQTSSAIAIQDLLRERNCSNAAAPHRTQRDGVRHRSRADLEPGLFDLSDEITGEAGLDAKSALDPLPGLGHHIFKEPLACRVIQRPDTDDRAVIGYLKIAHRIVRRSGMLRRLDPGRRAARRVAGDFRIRILAAERSGTRPQKVWVHFGVPRSAACSARAALHAVTPKPLPTRGRQGQGSGSELQELACSPFNFEPLVIVGYCPCVRGGSDRHVP